MRRGASTWWCSTKPSGERCHTLLGWLQMHLRCGAPSFADHVDRALLNQDDDGLPTSPLCPRTTRVLSALFSVPRLPSNMPPCPSLHPICWPSWMTCCARQHPVPLYAPRRLSRYISLSLVGHVPCPFRPLQNQSSCPDPSFSKIRDSRPRRPLQVPPGTQ